MELVIIPLVAVYIVLIAFGFSTTWRFTVNNILSGSGEIVFMIIIFILMILIIGPIMGIVNIVKLIIAYTAAKKQNNNSTHSN
jgi:hypothetical protein